MRCAKILMLQCFGKAQAYPEVRRAFSEVAGAQEIGADRRQEPLSLGRSSIVSSESRAQGATRPAQNLLCLLQILRSTTVDRQPPSKPLALTIHPTKPPGRGRPRSPPRKPGCQLPGRGPRSGAEHLRCVATGPSARVSRRRQARHEDVGADRPIADEPANGPYPRPAGETPATPTGVPRRGWTRRWSRSWSGLQRLRYVDGGPRERCCLCPQATTSRRLDNTRCVH